MAVRSTLRVLVVAALGLMLLGSGRIPHEVVPLWVDVSAAGLTVFAEDVPLRLILDEIGRVTGMRIRVDGADQENVTIAFEDVPVDEGLRRVLRAKNFFMVSAPRGGVGQAHVFRQGGTPPAERRVAEAADAGDRQDPRGVSAIRSEAIANPSSRRRLRALERLAANADADAAIGAVVEILERESNPQLLARALDIAGQDPSTPVDVLVNLARRNPDAQVRIKALNHLSKRGTSDARVRQTLEVLATDDAASEVRETARRLLGALTAP
jgi:hypothetical protein